MKKITLIFFALLYYGAIGISQQLLPEVIVATGNSTQGTYATLSWSLGEVSVETYSQNDVLLTQGFHQINLHPTAIEETNLSLVINIFPNPTPELITFSLDDSQALPLKISLYNMEGKRLLCETMTMDTHQLQLTDFPSGSYLLTLENNTGNIRKTYRIIKTF